MLVKITTKYASYSLVTFVTHKRFAVLFFLPSCCVNSLLLKLPTMIIFMSTCFEHVSPGRVFPTLPIRVCAAQRGRDFEAPDLERGIHFTGFS